MEVVSLFIYRLKRGVKVLLGGSWNNEQGPQRSENRGEVRVTVEEGSRGDRVVRGSGVEGDRGSRVGRVRLRRVPKRLSEVPQDFSLLIQCLGTHRGAGSAAEQTQTETRSATHPGSTKGSS